ncbi:hypothetical protein [Peterkaempfera bronchialis]|nr:hypothetical protein [Peterkaempfera bronchialis]
MAHHTNGSGGGAGPEVRVVDGGVGRGADAAAPRRVGGALPW